MKSVVILIFYFLLSSSLFAEGKFEDTFKTQKIKTFKRKVKKENLKKPALKSDTERLIKVKTKELEALENEIEAVNQLIEMSDPDDEELPDYYMRLADLYWEKATYYERKIYSEELAKELEKAQKAQDKEAIKKIELKKEHYRELARKWKQKTVDIYKKIVIRFKNNPNIDVFYYYLGVYTTALGNKDEGKEYFVKILLEYPNSKLFPDALYNVGNYFFDLNDFESAVKFYSKVESFKDSPVYFLALYKKGWCYFNLGEYHTALETFTRIVEESNEYLKKKGKLTFDLREDALNDIVRTYSQVGDPNNAIKVFKQLAPSKYLELARRLAEFYQQYGNYKKSMIVLKRLIKVNKKSYKIITYQRLIVDNVYKTDKIKKTIKEVARLIKLVKKLKDKVPKNYLKQELSLIGAQLREITTTQHEIAMKTKNPKYYKIAQKLYHYYFELFPNDEYSFEMKKNYASLLMLLKMYDKAVGIFEDLYRADPNGPYAKIAAHGALLCYFNLIDLSKVENKQEEVEELKPLKIPENFQKFINACKRFIKLSSPNDEDHVEAKFALGKILYDFNHFKEAAKVFVDIIEHHENHERAKISAKFLLSSLHLAKDIKGLNKWAEILEKKPKLLTADLKVIIKKIRDQAEFNKCFEYENIKKYKKAAICFLEYTKKFPNSKLIDKALYNSAINYNRARMMAKALTALGELYNRARNSKIAPSALYAIAEIYREAAVYNEAAKYYELYVKNHPKHKHVEKALQYASVFRKVLGEYNLAIKDYKLYLRKFPKSDKAPNVFLDIAIIYKTQKKYSKAISQFLKFVKKYPKRLDQVLFAYLQVAKIYLKLKKQKKAMTYLDKIIKIFKGLSKEELKKLKAGYSIVAEAKFIQSEIVLAKYKKIKLTYKNLQKALTEKLKIIAKAKEMLKDVYQMNQPNWMIAALDRLGYAYQELANTVENAPVPPKLNAEQREIYKQDLAQKADKIRQNAIAIYKKCINLSIQYKWFNKYSEHASENLAKLDYSYKFTKEYKLRAQYTSPGTFPYNMIRSKTEKGLEL